MMYEEDVYAGARAAMPRVPQVQPGQDVVGEVLVRGMQEVGVQVGAMLAQGAELEEAQHEFEAEAELLSVESDTRAEVERRLRLPDGDDESFWDARGRFREVEVRNLYDRVGRRMRGVGGMLLDPERRVRVQGRAMLAEERLLHDMGEVWQKAQWERSEKAWKAAFALAVDKDDRQGSLDLLDKGVAAGLLLRDEAELKRRRLVGDWAVQDQRGFLEQAAAVVDSPERFAALYDDPEFRARLSPESAARLDAMAARLPVDVPVRKVKRVQQGDGSVKSVAEPAQAPRGLPRGLVRVWNVYNGDFDGVDAREAAREPLMAYLRGLVQHADDPAELERAKAVCKVYGHSAEFADSMVKQLRKEIDGTAAFNAKEAMAQFTGRGLFFTRYNYDKVRALKQEHAGLAGRKRSKREQVRFTQLNEEIKKWEGWERSSSEGASRAILARFDDWLRAHPEASYREQARMFYGFVDSHSQDDAAVVDSDARADADAGVYDAKVARRVAARRAAGEVLQADVAAAELERVRMSELAAAAQVAADEEARAEADEVARREVAVVQLDARRGVSRNWAGDAERSILYVPKGHAMAGQSVKLSTPNDVCSYAEVVEHEGCTAPVMSQYLRRNLGVLHNPYGSIAFDGFEGKLGATRPAGGAMAKSLGGLAAYRDVFMDAAARNGLDPRLLMAIAMHETGRGTSSAFRNKKNAMGVSDAKGPRAFASVEDSIYFMARQLKRNYIDRGLRTVEQIGAKYAPIGAGNDPRGLNKHWVEGVSRYMNELN